MAVSPALSLPAPAKLNLFLHITGRRDDGYHTLQTLFQLLDFGDLLHFRASEPGALKVILSHDPPASETQPDIPLEENLIYRAAMALQAATRDTCGSGQSPLPGVEIELVKRLPVGGGVGGGSSDAATTLVGLNRFWQLGLSLDALCQLGATLGADVPVFIRGHSAWAEGVGNELTPVELPLCWYVVIKPDCEVSTSAIFQHQELTRNTHPITIRALFGEAASTTSAVDNITICNMAAINNIARKANNDCQVVTEQLYPQVAEARLWLTDKVLAEARLRDREHAQYSPARMTGTGACVFARFDNREQCEQVLADLPKHWFGFAAKGVNISPLYR